MNNRSSCNRSRWRPLIETEILSAILIGGLFLASPKARAADAPAWMHALVNAPLPKHDEKTDAVQLYFEEILTVESSGRVKEIDRAVYKVLRPSGRHVAKLHFYVNNDERINHIRGWCIPAQGKDYETKDKDVIETGVVGTEDGVLYSDVKVKTLEIPAPEPGNLIGYEVEGEGRRYILQDGWFFQHTLPVADTRYTLQLPPGWEYKTQWVNHPEVVPISTGNNQWQWQLKDVPEIQPEPRMPPWKGVAGLMIISLVPPGGASRGFLTWSEMGTWYAGLVQGRRDRSPEIKQKVAELTAQAKTPLAKMLAVSEFMQKDIRYVEIALGIGGVQPHPARDVFSNRYGDCKDKVTLLSAMLKEVGIESYYVVIHTERGGVTPATPPHVGAFDHMIIAIRLPDDASDVRLRATIQDPKLGKLLIFDPTDEITPFGALRGDLQSSYALLVAPDGGELVQTPELPTISNGIRRTAKLSLDSQGVLRGEVDEQRLGDSASHARAELLSVSRDSDRIKPVEQVMAESVSSFQITKASMTALHDYDQPFGFKWTFVAPEYAKSAGNLLLVRPRVLGVETNGLLETKEPRKYAVEFEGPRRDYDKVEITLPAGYEIDELPPPTDVDYSFGSYHSKTEAQGNVLKYTRTFEIKQLSVPVTQAEDLKKFYRIIGNDERSTAILKPSGH
jgi:transglutaminase-like putative cysteine protease